MKWFLFMIIVPALCLNLFASTEMPRIKLPKPLLKGKITVEEALTLRRSERTFLDRALSLSEAGQLLWAAQGVTDSRGYRAAPSAGATFPLETYLVAGKVSGLVPGIYRYIPDDHAIVLVKSGDVRKELSAAALGQWVVERAPATIVFCSKYSRTTGRYGRRGEMYVHMEAGHAGQNIYLQCAAMGLGTVAVGAFNENAVSVIIGCGKDEVPIYIFPAGRKR